MANAFTLWAEIKADTGALDRALSASDKKAEELTQSLTRTEKAAHGLGDGSATTAARLQKLQSTIAGNNAKLHEAAAAFKRGDISAKQMANVVNQVGRSSTNASNQIKMMTARLHDLAAAQQKAASAGKGGRLSSMMGSNEFLAGISGGLMGAGIAGAGLAAFGITKQMVGTVAQLGAESVRLAADFQKTTAAMTVFTGSGEKAKKELADLADLSRRTPGLGLVDAEQGATRLRAMGFDSETSKQLLTGLAKQKILSGVGSEAIDRTTLNLAQLASGGGDLQDIKDLVQNLPTARKEINEAFGSLQGFQAALKANPQAAIKRFAEELAGVTAPAGGFDDAMQKLNDSFIEMGRSAGQPLLDPITRSMQELTAIVHSNKDAWSSWGDFVANKINGVNAIVSAGRGLNEQTDGWLGWAAGKWAGQVIDQNIPTWAKALGLSVDTAGKAGQMYERLGALSPAKAGGVIDLGDKKQKSAMELQMEVLAEQARNKEAQEAAFRQARGQFLDQSESLVNTKLNNAYRVREAMLKNHLSASQASEIQSIQQTTALRNAQLAAQLQNEKVFLQERMKIAKPEEMAGLQMKLAEAESNAQAEMMANSLNAQAQIREAMKRTKEEIASIFIAGQQENPFVQIFDQGRLAAERITEATRGLSPALRESLMLMNQNAVATQAFGQALDNRLQASNLRDEARQFLQGKLDADSPANFQSNLDRQLNSIGAFGRGAFDGEDGGQIAKRVIALTQGVDPSKLTASQRRVAADARLVEAARLEKQEEDALNTQKQLVKVLTDLENAVKGGAIVKVVNEAPEKAKVQTKPRAADAASYYNTASTAMTRVNI